MIPNAHNAISGFYSDLTCDQCLLKMPTAGKGLFQLALPISFTSTERSAHMQRTVAENFDLIEKVVCRYNRALNISILLLIAITKVINVLCQDVEIGTVDFFLRRKIIRF